MTTIILGENSPIGLHIKKRRLELKLRQTDVARILGLCEDSIRFWEGNKAIPQIQHIPKVIKFLGYNPYAVENETLGGRVKNYRLLHGLSHRKMGKMVGVDAATISTWETGKFNPDGPNLNRLNGLLRD